MEINQLLESSNNFKTAQADAAIGFKVGTIWTVRRIF